MFPHKFTLTILVLLLVPASDVFSQRRKAPAGGRVAVVVDERLAVVRESPQLDGKLIQRLGRGRLVAVRSSRRTTDGLVFLFVNVSSRTGWIQREAVAVPSNVDDEERLLSLIQNAREFDRIARAKIFLEFFPRSLNRAKVLLLLGDAAESVSSKLSRDAARRVDATGPTQVRSYFMNHSGLDRYNRLGVLFIYDSNAKCLRYNGTAWREIVRRYPTSDEAVEARKRLQK